MSIKYKENVPIDNPSEAIINARTIIEKVYKRYFDQDLVITSTSDGKHMTKSKHYKVPREAEDYRFPDKFRNFMWSLVAELGEDYDIVIEKDHIHVEKH